MSLAQGIATGYGLVQRTKEANRAADFRDRQLAENAAYREESLGLQRQQIQDLANYRTEKLALDDKIAGLEDAYRTLKEKGAQANQLRDDNIALVNAQVAGTNAEVARLRAENEKTKLGLELDDAKAIADFSAADNLFTLSQADLPTRQRLQPIADSALKQLKGSTNINLDSLASMDLNAYDEAYMQMLNGLATGQLERVDNVQMAALTDMIGLDNTQSIGKKITPEEFPSAPPEFEGHTIVDITGHDAVFVEGNKIRGELAVKLRAPDGSHNYYYPDLTEYRGGNTPQLLIDANDGMKKFGGTALFYANLQNNPVFMKYIDDERVKEKGGATEVDAAVQARVDAVEKVLEDNREAKTASAIFIENHDLQYLVKPGEDIGSMLDNMSIIYDRARKNHLYGTPTQDKVNDARDFTGKLQGLMPQVQVDTGDRSLQSTGANSRQTVRGSGVVSLTDLIGADNLDRLTPNQMAYINAMITSPDDLTIPAKKFDRLQEYLINQGLMARP